jgi:hypothetical protein
MLSYGCRRQHRAFRKLLFSGYIRACEKLSEMIRPNGRKYSTALRQREVVLDQEDRLGGGVPGWTGASYDKADDDQDRNRVSVGAEGRRFASRMVRAVPGRGRTDPD